MFYAEDRRLESRHYDSKEQVEILFPVIVGGSRASLSLKTECAPVTRLRHLSPQLFEIELDVFADQEDVHAGGHFIRN